MLKKCFFVQSSYGFMHIVLLIAQFFESVIKKINEWLHKFYVGGYAFLPFFVGKIFVRKVLHN